MPDGTHPALDSRFFNVPFRLLPGIVEILKGKVRGEDLVNYVLKKVAFTDDVSSRFDVAKQSYFAIDGSEYTDCSLLFSIEESRFGICTSWKGKPFLDDNDRSENFIQISPDIVRNAWTEDPLDLFDVDFTWSKFRSHYQAVWKIAFEKHRNSIKFKIKPKPRHVSCVTKHSPSQLHHKRTPLEGVLNNPLPNKFQGTTVDS